MFTSNNDNWATPREFFDALDREFHFTLDACALPENAKCEKYFTPDVDGLQQDWGGAAVFCNPPYGRTVGQWVRKAYHESHKHDTVVVMLLPARTDTSWFHDWIYHRAEIRFIRGRLKFGDSKNSAPFPSMIVIFNNKNSNL